MRGRGYGRGAEIGSGSFTPPLEEKREDGGDAADKQKRSDRRSWLNIAAAVATLTLGVIKVIRDTGDLYHRLKDDS
jgi:hypothetical protein